MMRVGRLRKIFTTLLAVLVAGTVLALGIGISSALAAGIPSDSSSLDPVMQAQAPLLAASNAIDALVESAHLTGYSGAVIEPTNDALDLYWNGPVPSQVARLIQGLPVRLLAAPYSLAELDSEQRRLMSVYPAIEETGVLADFSGITVTADPAMSALPIVSTIKTSVNYVHKSYVPLAGRFYDTHPFWGGDAILSSTTYCSFGFEIAHNGDNTSGVTTANHCGEGVAWKTYYGGTSVGASVTCNPVTVCESVDAVPVTLGHALPNSDYQPYIYYGAWNATTGSPVIASANPVLNANVCTNGAYTGTSCSTNTVTAVNQYEIIDGVQAGPGFWITKTNHADLAGNGDSGGGIVTFGTNFSSATAYGEINLADTTTGTTCSGAPNIPNRACFYRIFSVNFNSILSTLGSYLCTPAKC
jgi:hypothetical protein